jgi:hypothetical protein
VYRLSWMIAAPAENVAPVVDPPAVEPGQPGQESFDGLRMSEVVAALLLGLAACASAPKIAPPPASASSGPGACH